MLKTSKSININGTSMAGSDLAATMNASISEDGGISLNTYIQNKEVYEANKTEVQSDIEAFNQLVYSMEV